MSKTTAIKPAAFRFPSSEEAQVIADEIRRLTTLRTDSSFIPSSEAYERAMRLRIQENEARAEIAVERLTEEEWPYFNSTLRDSQTALAKAREELRSAEEMLQRGLGIQAEWQRIVAEFAAWADRLECAEGSLQKARAAVGEQDAESIRRANSNSGSIYSRIAIDAAVRNREAIPGLETALAAVRDGAREHVATMRAFVKNNGLPTHLLTDLPNF